MAAAAGIFYTAGGAAAVGVSVGLGHGFAGPARPLWLMAGLALTGGAALLARGHLLPRGAFHAVVLGGTALLTAAILASAAPSAALALAPLYTFIAVNCALFFRWPQALAHLAVVLAAQALALGHDPVAGPGPALVTGIACIAVALVAGGLVRRASDASRDSLTGLLNRRGFDDALEAALAAAERGDAPLAVALLDLDRFKLVNDRHGHGAGDALLSSVAAGLAAAAPPAALVTRPGGDEFAVLLPGASAHEARAAVERMRDDVGRARGHVPGCAVSAGIAVRLPGESGADVVRRADAALFAAKAAGRDRTVLSGGDSSELAAALAAALAAGGIDVALQPVLRLGDRRVVGVEALARWTDPVRGPVPPADFVPVAEAAGLVGQLGAAVLARACRDAGRLVAAEGRRLLLTVNASGRELVEPGYAGRVLDTLERTGWRPEDLVVEVTESLVEASSTTALQALAELRGQGVAVAIDDFGTGYSSFSRLDTLPADYLKLDHSFIATTTTSPRRAGMLRALLDLSGALGLQVIAEGVETPEHERLLVELGCPLGQGYLYAAPQPVEVLIARAGDRAPVPLAS